MSGKTTDPGFQGPLITEDLDGPWARLHETLPYFSPRLDEYDPYFGGYICVPEDFVTDFASVPRAPVVYWLWGSVADRPAVIHDYLYRAGEELEIPRKICDEIYYEAMEFRGYSWITKYPHYAGVRFGGSSAYGGEFTLDPREDT